MPIKSEVLNTPSHKTVIVIDRSREFSQRAVETSQLFKINDGEGDSRENHLTRWSVAIQGVFEFFRVISDLYPYGSKQIRLCVSDTAARFITGPWRDSLVTYDEIMRALFENQPDRHASSSSSSILNGLNMSMDALTSPTTVQSAFMGINAETYRLPENFNGTCMPNIEPTNVSDARSEFYKRLEKIRPDVQKNVFFSPKISEINNLGTIMVYTSVDSLERLEKIVSFVEDQVATHNEIYKTSGHINFSILPLSMIRLLIIHIASVKCTKLDQKFMADCTSFCLSKRGLVKPSIYFANGTMSLNMIVHQILCTDYGIASTTISGIPMKEESDPKTSHNYDVEILHHKRAHSFFNINKLLEFDSPISAQVNQLYVTAKLKWSSVNNRFQVTEPPMFTNSSIATLAFVRNRPATCLCMFLMNGKNVLLDVNLQKPLATVPINFANTTISHVCTSDINSDSMAIKCLSFDLPDAYKLLPEQRSANLDYNAYKNLLVLRRIEPVSVGKVLVDRNPRPFFQSQQNEQVALQRLPRSESPSIRTKVAHNWVENETINVYEYFSKKQETCWNFWRDFVGRTGEKPAILYPNLKPTENSGAIGGARSAKKPRKM